MKNHGMTFLEYIRQSRLYAGIAAWLIAALAFLNALCFVIRTANPVYRSDDWYFLEVFVKKAIDGTLGIADFFVKRQGADHAQPMFKLALWFEWRFLDLDVSFEAVIGVFGCVVCLLILKHFVMHSKSGGRSDMLRYLAWAAMCVLLFSLNATGIWTWPLVTIEYLTFIPMLLFIWATWSAWNGRGYLLLAVTTLFLGVADDDSALIAILAVLLAVLVVAWRDVNRRQDAIWKIGVVIFVCMGLVRIGYAYAPVVGGAPSPTVSANVAALIVQVHKGGWWKWVTEPLLLPVASLQPFGAMGASTWSSIENVIVLLLVLAHVWFWWRALRGDYNLPMFAAVCLMILTYGWIAGIIFYRVSFYGSSYINEDRYIRLYQFNLVALLLMWAGSIDGVKKSRAMLGRHMRILVPSLASVLLIALQFPLSHKAWHSRRYLLSYYHDMAQQLWGLAKDPRNIQGCKPELVVCREPMAERAASIKLLANYRMNIFSKRVQEWHAYLPSNEEMK